MKLNFTNIVIIICATLLLYNLWQNYINKPDNTVVNKNNIANIVQNTGSNIVVDDSTNTGNLANTWTKPKALAILDINSFVAKDTEPFWAANFSGSTMVFQNPDIWYLNITGIVWPSIYSGIYTRANASTNPLITINMQLCSDGMSEKIYSGSVDINISWYIYKWCVTILP